MRDLGSRNGTSLNGQRVKETPIRLKANDRIGIAEERVSQGLENLSFEERQKLLRLVVDHIIMDGQRIRIEGGIPVQGHNPEVSLRSTRPVDQCHFAFFF